MEQERNPGGGEEFGVGGALVGGEEHVGVQGVEGRGEQGGGGRSVVAREAVQGEAAGGERQPGVDDGGPCPGEHEAEDGSDDPGDGWIEDEAGLPGVPSGCVGPVGVEVAVGELVGSFKPVEDVEVEVVAAGAALEDERKDSDERDDRDEDVGNSIAPHDSRVSRIWGADSMVNNRRCLIAATTEPRQQALPWRKGEGMGDGGVDGGVSEGHGKRGAVIPDGPLVHEPGAGGVAGLAEDDVQGAVVEVGEVGGEALGGTEAAGDLLDGGVVAALRLRAGADGLAYEELKDRGLAEDGVFDVDGIGVSVAPFTDVQWRAGAAETFGYGGRQEVVPCGVFGGKPAGGSVHDEPLLGVGLFSPDVELGGIVGVGCGL